MSKCARTQGTTSGQYGGSSAVNGAFLRYGQPVRTPHVKLLLRPDRVLGSMVLEKIMCSTRPGEHFKKDSALYEQN